MNNREQKNNQLKREGIMRDLERKRLERGKGSERRLVTPERSAGVTSGAEKRSEEDIGVTPVKAGALARFWEISAANFDKEKKQSEDSGDVLSATVSSTMAATLRVCAADLRRVIKLSIERKPESEPERSDGERRRNVELCQPCPPSTPPRQETADGQGLA